MRAAFPEILTAEIASARIWRRTRSEKYMILRALEERWDLGPEKRSELVNLAMGWARDKSDPRVSLKAIQTLVGMERQNQADDHSEDQMKRILTAIEARLRYAQQLPAEPSPLLLTNETQALSDRDLQRGRAVVLEAITDRLTELRAGKAGDNGSGNGNGRPH